MGGIVGWEKIKMASANTPSVNEPAKASFSTQYMVKLKPNIKGQISGKLVTSGLNDVAIVSVHSEKNRVKKMITIIIIISMNKLQELTVFGGCQKLTSAMKQRPEK